MGASITHLQSYLKNQPEYSFIIQQAIEQKYNLIHGVSGGQRGFLTAAIAQSQDKDILFAAENTQRAREIIDDLENWLPEYQVLYFPALDIISFEVLALSKETRWARIEVLQALLFAKTPVAVVTTVEALRKTMLPKEDLIKHFRMIKVGDTVGVMDLVAWLVERGYERVERVEEKGQVALRGGILDVFSPTAVMPWRLEFFDDEVDSIRLFSQESQRSIEKVEEAFFAPASECVFSEGQRESIIAGLLEEQKGIQRRRRSRRSPGNTEARSLLRANTALLGDRMEPEGRTQAGEWAQQQPANPLQPGIEARRGDGTRLVEEARRGEEALRGDGTRLGEEARPDAWAQLGDEVRPAGEAQPGNRASQLVELLMENGFFPGHEQLLPYAGVEPALITDYFNRPVLPVMAEPSRQREASQLWEKDYSETCLDLLEKGRICPGQMRNYLNIDELARRLGEDGLLFLALLPRRPAWFENTNTLGLTAKSISLFMQKTQLLADELKEWKRQQYCVLILVSSADRGERLRDSLRDLALESHWVEGEFAPVHGGVYILIGKASGGFDLPGMQVAIVSEYELYFQPKKNADKRIFREGKKRLYLEDLKPGDYIVHINYGIGRYHGIENITVDQSQRDYLVIDYSGTDRLYVPTDQAELLQKYTGQEGSRPKLSRLGGSEWGKAKAKARKAVDGMADDLLDLYAAREALPGIAFGEDTVWQKEFEESFPFEETPDQLRSIDEVKEDMERARPMDRLLCGDVGYGKTEVAMRAAFKAAASGRQVAILAPTTVLTQQHYTTFRERFDGFAMEVAVLNRFRRPAEQKDTLKRVAQGKVDILIGTHRILSSDVDFKNLGLLVVDEEQRFGVTHKEKIKKLKQNVDVLTLTATPIPRTLHMALSGMRDMSVIETAPEDRYPVQTYVVEYSVPLVREAILRELGRGGQVYYVHNRIEDIDRVRESIEAIVPEASVASAHGRMTEAVLERTMFDFMEGDVDVLVCTTIIESGLDISNANTVIIDHADTLGLAQLYQIRGRVGRSSRVAYAYLTYTKERAISEVAEKRMSAIREFTDLGAGYKIAMRDLEIRGAGNILGAEQHGQIAAVGFDLYCRMLEDAMKKKRMEREAGHPLPDLPDNELEAVTIDLQVKAYIPAEYMEDESAKIDFYQRINHALNAADIEDLREEMVDRFGDLPGPLENLLAIGTVKALAKDAKIAGVLQEQGNIRITMAKDHSLMSPELVELVKQYQRGISFNATDKLEIILQPARGERQDIIGYLLSVVKTIVELCKQQ
ncbi:MAG: transcription-repair coupling factor [Clostridiales bacterium]|nr:transcription-repair coupling factor [Clostridiales bacterium]